MSWRKGVFDISYFYNTGTLLVDSGALWCTLVHFDALWDTFGALWCTLGHFQCTLVHFGALWSTLEHFGALSKYSYLEFGIALIDMAGNRP